MGFELLVACCQYHVDSNEIQKLASEITNWPNAINLAHQNGVLPLLFKRLQHHKINIPHQAIKVLKQLHSSHTLQHLQMTGELIRVTQLFKENSIEAIAIKGPVLSQMAYGDITTRQYLDLDLLTSEETLFDAANMLLEAGYRPTHPIKFLKNNALLKADKDLAFYHQNNGVKIELHWQLFEKRLLQNNLKEDTLYASQSISINNTTLQTLAVEPLVLYLAMHGSKHYWERLEWIADIDRLIVKNDIDWELLTQLADSLHVRTMFYLGLRMAQKFFNTPLPEMIKNNIQTNLKVTKLEEIISYNLHHTIRSKIRDIPGNIKKVNSLSDGTGLGYFYKITFGIKPQDIYLINLPRSLHLLYFVIRPFRLLYDYTIKKN